MRSRRLIWRIYLSYLLLILGTLTAVTWHISNSVHHLYLESAEEDLRARVFLMSDPALNALLFGSATEIDSLCDALGGPIQTRITVVSPTGEVIADTDEDPELMNNHADRPEIMRAFTSGTGSSVRFSHTIGEDMMYVASALRSNDSLVGYLRAAIPLTAIDEALAAIRLKIIVGSVVVAALAALIGLWVSSKLTQPLEALRQGVERFARGDFKTVVRATGSLEVEQLSEAANHMARQLDSKITEIIDQRSERDAILSSMVEGVLAVDNSEKILSINQAAAEWFQVESAQALGRTLRETVRNPELLSFVSETLMSSETTEGEFVHWGAGERILRAHGARLRSASQSAIGAVVVMSDITKLKQLDSMRKDFVANVSHELKTPITSIKGFVETLLDSEGLAVEERTRFLKIIARQSDRLNTIIDDLLTLSRLEQVDPTSEHHFADTELHTVIHSAVSLCAQNARQNSISINVSCPALLTANIDAQLFEQALVNLIDNAVKYSDHGSSVEITGKRDDQGKLTICVTDHGPGIESRHLPRLFERFYRADKARSREKGGTGLGLAIVKHIVQLHGGQVLVSSAPGSGSSFKVVLNPSRQAGV